MTARTLVLDANILVRAVLGPRVRNLIVDFAPDVDFFAPSIAFEDAERHLPTVAGRRGIDPALTLETLDTLRPLVEVVPAEAFEPHRTEALRRLRKRDAALVEIYLKNENAAEPADG